MDNARHLPPRLDWDEVRLIRLEVSSKISAERTYFVTTSNVKVDDITCSSLSRPTSCEARLDVRWQLRIEINRDIRCTTQACLATTRFAHALVSGLARPILVSVILLPLVCGCGARDVDSVGTWEPVRWGILPGSPGLDPHDAPITFHEDGTWTGRDGCHDVSGTYTLEGESITTPPVAGTGIGCPEGDIPYDALMAGVRKVERTDDTLIFRTPDDKFALELTKVP